MVRKCGQAVISDILLAIEVYMVPCIYSAMVAARDEVVEQMVGCCEEQKGDNIKIKALGVLLDHTCMPFGDACDPPQSQS